MTPDELEAAIRFHNWKYWIQNAPEISDFEYDRLVEALRRHRPDSPLVDEIGTAGAAGEGEVQEPGEKVRHTRPMLSLDKCYEEAELLKWFDKFEGDAVASPKIDGVAASIRYAVDGRLELAATRGSGRVGDVITENIKRVGAVPHILPFGPLEVRGEVYMPLSVFRTEFAQDFSNPRNLTAGSVTRKDPETTAPFKLRFMAYDVDPPPGVHPETEVDKEALLTRLGFSPVETILCEREQVESVYRGLLARRDDFDYETDGVVFKTNHLDEQRLLGATAHHPRYAIAYKFQGESGVSTLVAVEWSVSRTGAINPVAIVDPIVLSGVSVTRASLHNLSIMAKLGGEEGLRLGSKVLMERRGGVIPHVEGVVDVGTRRVTIPTVCPSCGGAAYERDDVLHAEHTPTCPATTLGQFQHFVHVIDSKGFGPKLLQQLLEAGLVEEPSDLFRLTLADLMGLERVGEKLATRLLRELGQCRTLSMDTFLNALGIDELGPVVARLIARSYPDLEALRSAGTQDLSGINGVGPIIAENVVNGLAARSDLIDRLLAQIVLAAPELPPEPTGQGSLSGLSFLFTGTLATLKRKEAQALVRAEGGDAPNAVNRSLTHLVIGDADLAKFEGGWRTSKLKKAEKLNEGGAEIQIIGESAFLEMVEE
jgi:DNA ligase (NAD+)